jgi:tetratricopeptide (TPR) repeat protein
MNVNIIAAVTAKPAAKPSMSPATHATALATTHVLPSPTLSDPVFPPAAYGAILITVVFAASAYALISASRKQLTPEVRNASLMLALTVGLFLGLLTIFFCPGLSAYAWAAVELIGLGLFSVGLVVGFLFGVPQYIKDETAAQASATATQSAPALRQILQPNSNISKVSDWLTTAITAVTLSQIVVIPKYILAFGQVLETALGVPHYGIALATGLVLYFPSLGFMTGYIVTTIYLSRAINEAAASLIPPDVQTLLKNLAPTNLPLTSSSAATGASPQVQTAGGAVASFVGAADFAAGVTIRPLQTKDVEGAIKSATSVPLSQLTTAEDKAAWARAQALRSNWKDAILGFQQAIALKPNDPYLLENYASALYNSGADIHSVIEAYNRALQLLHGDPTAKSRVLANLALAHLYLPSGYEKTLEYVNQVLNDPVLPKNPVLYFYRACANGQKWMMVQDSSERQQLHDAIMEDARTALTRDPNLRSLLQMVSDPNYPDKDKEDSDLEAFAAASADYRTLIGLDQQQLAGGTNGAQDT